MSKCCFINNCCVGTSHIFSLNCDGAVIRSMTSYDEIISLVIEDKSSFQELAAEGLGQIHGYMFLAAFRNFQNKQPSGDTVVYSCGATRDGKFSMRMGIFPLGYLLAVGKSDLTGCTERPIFYSISTDGVHYGVPWTNSFDIAFLLFRLRLSLTACILFFYTS